MIFEFNGYKPVIHESSFVHPQANVTGNVIIGKDVYIGPGAAIRGDWGEIIIEDGCNVQESCTIHMFPGTTVTLKKGVHIGHGAIIHGSQPNNSDQRRIGFSLQSYVPPYIKQVVGRNIWTHIRGKKRQDNDGIELDRPKYNMDPITVEQRRVAEENLSEILYKGAKIKRKY